MSKANALLPWVRRRKGVVPPSLIGSPEAHAGVALLLAATACIEHGPQSEGAVYGHHGIFQICPSSLEIIGQLYFLGMTDEASMLRNNPLTPKLILLNLMKLLDSPQ
jgi:hypothetical protein